MLESGERQVAPDLSGIRRDHVARYEFALTRIPRRAKVIDLACGVGYGSDLLARRRHNVLGIDRDREAIAYARQHYGGAGATFQCADAGKVKLPKADAAVCFETIEHLADPLPMLRNLRSAAKLLIASVPNETVFPFRNYKFHHRHYTRAEFEQLLAEAGWQVTEWHGQAGPHSEVESNLEGRTLVAVAKQARQAKRKAFVKLKPSDLVPPVPDHVVIVGLGPSSATYMDLAKRLGDRKVFADEVWAINAMGSVIQCDRIFHMDDLKIQEARAERLPDSNIAHMVRWLKTHPGPIYTSKVRPGYKGLVEYPLQDVLRNGGFPYFNSTAAYAIAYAIHIGVKEVSLYGIDYTLKNMHTAEQGRACCEFWIGLGMARGVLFNVPEQTSLMDACEPEDRRFYGYDCFDVELADDASGLQVNFSEKSDDRIPTAAQIEDRYNHSHHPNPLMRKGASR